MKNKVFSYKVVFGCIIAFALVLIGQCAFAQTVTIRRQDRGKIMRWNNAAYFKDTPKRGPFNWRDYPETWDGKQFVTWTLFAASGVMWGAREAYHADPYLFERVYGAGNESFWGSDAWKRNYLDNNPDNPHKSEWAGNVGRDMWHTFGFSSNAVLFSGTFAIGVRRQPVKYRALNLLLGIGTRSLFASLTYNSLRAK